MSHVTGVEEYSCQLPDGRTIAAGDRFEFEDNSDPLDCLCPNEPNQHGTMTVHCKHRNDVIEGL